jgi:hypothetical protein
MCTKLVCKDSVFFRITQLPGGKFLPRYVEFCRLVEQRNYTFV